MIKNIVKLLVGIMLIVSVLIGYLPYPEYMIELTCLSNTFGGLILIIDAIVSFIRGKGLPAGFHLSAAITLMFVFMVCALSITGLFHFNFGGAFLFLHVVNPLAFLACYLLFINERGRKMRWIITAPVAVVIYLIFDFIIGNIRGNFVYGFFETSELGIPMAIGLGAAAFAAVCIGATGLFFLNRLIHRLNLPFMKA